ncbi:MAG: SAM-dependent chlorinase/fluorinase [Planctomycetaceae bacterium]|nr:SAM-dependent chlorinase/fluorinase [Planctomycetaceae bacterium]
MLITLLTDFGEGSQYVAQMKGVILGIHSEARIVDVSHSVPPQAIQVAGRRLDSIVDAFSADTCHIVVVDPGVGTERHVLLARMREQFFIGPDNGVFTAIMERCSPDWVRVVDQPRFWRPPISSTFHGRDIMAPVAAHLGEGISPEKLASEVDEWVREPSSQPRVFANRLEATIVEVDSFGNLITNVGQDQLPANSGGISVSLHDRSGIDRVQTYADREPGCLVALIGSGGDLEIAIVNGNAAKLLSANLGDSVVISW